MARATSRSMKKPASSACGCSLGHMIVAWILFAVGLFVLVGGFVGQLNSTLTYTYVLVYYFVGIVVLSFAKMLKWKAVSTCSVHGCCKK